MKGYALSQEFLNSRDLRVGLAMTPPGSPQYQLFETLRKQDRFIRIQQEGSRPTVGYHSGLVAGRDVFHQRVASSGPMFVHPKRHCNLQYKKGSCVLLGAATNPHLSTVRELQETGFVVIALGNAGWLYPAADIWVGHKDLLRYTTRGLESSRTLSVVPKDTPGDFWDLRKQEVYTQDLDNFPNIVRADLQERRSAEEFFSEPAVTDFGIPISFTVGLSLSLMFGFDNIILSGIHLEGSIEQWYEFQEIPHKATYEERTKQYAQAKAILKTVHTKAVDHGIRLYGLGETALGGPALDPKYLDQMLLQFCAKSRQELSLNGITVPSDKKREKYRQKKDIDKAILTVLDVADRMKEVLDGADVFNVEKYRESYRKLQERIATASCSGCTKRGYASELYNHFVQEVERGNEDVLSLWKELFPSKYIVKIGARKLFREDRKDMQALYRGF